jgi:AcrR family transcriptional regulator
MKKEKPDESVKHLIVAAATQVFENYGITRVSMQDISKASKLGRSSLYYYFKNKGEVFDAVGEKLIKEIFDKCSGQVDPEASLTNNLEKFQSTKLREIKKMNQKYHLAFLDLKQDPSVLFAKMRVMLAEETDLLEQMIGWAIKREEIRQLTKEEQHFLAEIIVTTFRSFEQEIVLFDRFPNMEAKLSWLVTIFVRGLK